MTTKTDKSQENKSWFISNALLQKQSGGESIFPFIDNRPGAFVQRKLQEMANNSKVVQRAILHRIDGTGTTFYYTDLDPSRNFRTHDEALAHERSFPFPRERAQDTRYPTLYTHTHTRPGNAISNRGIPQGPHTFGYAAVADGLVSASHGQSVVNTFLEQCPEPNRWRDLVIGEYGAHAFSGDSSFSHRLLGAYRDYTTVYRETEVAIREGREDDARDNIERLVQLHPYATFGWRSTTAVSARAIRGHGETADLHDDGNIARGGRWRNPGEFESFIEDRRLLDDPDYDSQ